MKAEGYIKAPSFVEKLLRLLYPVKCMICDSYLQEDSTLLICQPCRNNLPRCKKGFHKLSYLPHVEGILAPLYYDEGIDKAIQAMKFKNQPRLSETLAALICEELANENFHQFDCIIPVPMYPGKQRQRGYNQSELVAKSISKFLGIPVACSILEKTKYTRPQVGLPREQRLINLHDSFRVKVGEKSNLVDKKILLVDDVVTTGTTLNTCAKILHDHEAKFVYATVIAIAEK